MQDLNVKTIQNRGKKHATLQELLETSTEGRAILKSDRSLELERSSKLFISHVIIEYELGKRNNLKARVTRDVLEKWAEKIVE